MSRCFSNLMWYLYVIQSCRDHTLYTGITKNINNRVSQHNSGKNRFTKGHIPWKLIYSESFLTAAAARCREKYFKSAAGRRFIKKFLKNRVAGSPPDWTISVVRAGLSDRTFSVVRAGNPAGPTSALRSLGAGGLHHYMALHTPNLSRASADAAHLKIAKASISLFSNLLFVLKKLQNYNYFSLYTNLRKPLFYFS